MYRSVQKSVAYDNTTLEQSAENRSGRIPFFGSAGKVSSYLYNMYLGLSELIQENWLIDWIASVRLFIFLHSSSSVHRQKASGVI